MVRFLSKLLNIRPGEWPRLSVLYVMFFVFVTSWTWAVTILEAVFLRQVGVAALPWFFVIKAVISIPAVAVYVAFADRVANDKLLIAILGASMLGIVTGFALLGWGLSKIAYPLLYLIIFVPLEDIFYTHWYVYINDFYDTRSAKRIVPVLVTAVGIGGIVGGLTMPLLNRFLSPVRVVFVWLGALMTVAFLTWLMPYLLKESRTASEQLQYTTGHTGAGKDKQHLSQIDNIREGYHYVSQSSFLRWLALSTLLLMLLLTSLQYRTSQILLAELETVEGMSNFIGRLTGVTYLIMLPIQLFLLSRIIGKIGLGNGNLIYPIGSVAICGGLILTPSLPTAALAYFGRTNFYGIIGYTIETLLYNAIPLRVKGRARAFVYGFIVPVGSLLGGLLLLSPLVAAAWFVPTFIGVLVVAFMVNAFMIRQQYSRALIAMLEQEDFSFLLSQEASALAVTDPAMLNQLQKKLEESTSHEFTIFMAKLISQVGSSKALPILGQAARAATDARTRAALIDVIVAADLRGDAVSQLYTDFLADPDSRVRQSAIAGLDQLYSPADQPFLRQLLEMVQDPDLDVRVRVLTGLVDASDFYQLTLAVQELNRLLADENPHHRARGVRVLGQIRDERAIHHLVEYLTDPADEVRLEAAMAVETLSRDGLPDQTRTLIVNKMSPLLQDPIERVRQAALIVLGRLGTRESHQAMVDALTDPSPQVRATAVDTLVQTGKAVIPIVHRQFDSPDPQLRKMATVILSRINPKEFGALVGSSITGNLITIYQNYGLAETLTPCNGYPSIAVLQSALRERNQQLIDEIFYLLTAVHDPDAVKIISESLRSESARARANAAEALESLTTPQPASLIAPLFEPDLPPTQLLSISKDTWDMEHPDTARAIQQIMTNPGDPWLRTITTFALGEIGATLSPMDSLDEQKERRARRSPPADLFGALDDTIVDTAFQSGERPILSESGQFPFTLSQIETMLEVSLADPVDEVRFAAQAAKRAMAGLRITDVTKEEATLLSTIERIIFLKEVPFFQGMTIDQLRVLANVCEEELFEKDTRIFNEDDPGGVLYVVVHGRVGIEQEKRKGSFARLANIEAHSYFGEMNLFDNSPRSTSAIAIQDTLTLRLRREPLIALARQHPDLSLELINVLSARLRETSDRVADLTRTRPRELHKLYDQFD